MQIALCQRTDIPSKLLIYVGIIGKAIQFDTQRIRTAHVRRPSANASLDKTVYETNDRPTRVMLIGRSAASLRDGVPRWVGRANPSLGSPKSQKLANQEVLEGVFAAERQLNGRILRQKRFLRFESGLLRPTIP